MSEGPDNLILTLLRDIRGNLDRHDLRFDEMSSQLGELNKKIDDWQEATATAVGLGSHANLRNTALEARIDDPIRRVEELERAR
ncbi:hypothetical protein NPA31_006050 [Aurantimonas sp. MSK8Z-1]|uniref:hypothetical protein n=1 Tax=Mangrovibrevibacter kandeliae TaxID=2968473 RepID=UPI002118DC08|nr:hypothetical protein [Aurantimonas sp. MSK8Z-1]MCW4114522.1 hypothetical protein [Aurantimonas sp. MSK8Z-1]